MTDEQPVYFSDGVDPISRSWPGELFLLTIKVRPDPGSERCGDAGGGFANCYVDADDLRTAERRAVDVLRATGWQPYRFDEWSIVTPDTYAGWEPADEGDPDLREIVEQAFTDGEVCVLYTWPADAPDADEDD